MQAFDEETCYYTCGDIWTPKLYREYKDYSYTPRIDCVGRIHGCSWIGVTTICNEVSKNCYLTELRAELVNFDYV